MRDTTRLQSIPAFNDNAFEAIPSANAPLLSYAQNRPSSSSEAMASRLATRAFSTTVRRLQAQQAQHAGSSEQALRQESKRNPELMVRQKKLQFRRL